jgi:hypothetical protein
LIRALRSVTTSWPGCRPDVPMSVHVIMVAVRWDQILLAETFRQRVIVSHGSQSDG